MVLSGTLREFILADVMQLLTQQKVTGKLSLNNGRVDGSIIFRDGNVVSAARDKETFSQKLYNYLTRIQNHPKNKTRELFSSYEGKIAELTLHLEKKEILAHNELEAYASSIIEDISCSLFLWSSGSYRFDSMPSVDHLVPAGISIPVENIVMEAMRRIDEWHRMREIITEENIFVHTENDPCMPKYSKPLDDPASFFYAVIDGISSVKSLSQDSFVSEYKIYESIYSLIQGDYIRPLSESITQTIRAALRKNEQENKAVPTAVPLVSILISTTIIIVIAVLSILFRGVLFSDLTIRHNVRKNETPINIAKEHLKDAILFHKSHSFTPLSEIDERYSYPMITKRDKKFLTIKKRGFD